MFSCGFIRNQSSSYSWNFYRFFCKDSSKSHSSGIFQIIASTIIPFVFLRIHSETPVSTEVSILFCSIFSKVSFKEFFRNFFKVICSYCRIFLLNLKGFVKAFYMEESPSFPNILAGLFEELER